MAVAVSRRRRTRPVPGGGCSASTAPSVALGRRRRRGRARQRWPARWWPPRCCSTPSGARAARARRSGCSTTRSAARPRSASGCCDAVLALRRARRGDRGPGADDRPARACTTRTSPALAQALDRLDRRPARCSLTDGFRVPLARDAPRGRRRRREERGDRRRVDRREGDARPADAPRARALPAATASTSTSATARRGTRPRCAGTGRARCTARSFVSLAYTQLALVLDELLDAGDEPAERAAPQGARPPRRGARRARSCSCAASGCWPATCACAAAGEVDVAGRARARTLVLVEVKRRRRRRVGRGEAVAGSAQRARLGRAAEWLLARSPWARAGPLRPRRDRRRCACVAPARRLTLRAP